MLSEPRLIEIEAPEAGKPGATHRLACWQWGDPSAKRTVLCVHGLTRNGRDFDFLARALEADFHVLCPDMPGRGKSGFLADPAGYNNPAYLSDLAFLLGSLGIARVDWVGTSMGGILGMMAANAFPGLLRSLTLNDIGTVISAAGLTRIAEAAAMKGVYDTSAEAEAAFRLRTATFGIRREAHWRHLLEHGVRQGEDGAWRFTYDPSIFLPFTQEAVAADIDLGAMWEKVTAVPVLLIRGAQSDLLTRETAQVMQSRHPRLAYHEVEGAGHAPSLMEDKEIALIQGWISALREE